MAQVLAVLCSGRRKGFTARLLLGAVEGIKSVKGVEAEVVRNLDYRYGPCISCFNCIRSPENACTLNDDFGRSGRGPLFEKVKGANALLLADPVHMWGESSGAHLFMERLYPFLWTDHLNGVPFASISCASNQGMQRLARQNLCKFAFTYGMRYVGGLAVHVASFDQGLEGARLLGARLAEAALLDEKDGRRRMEDQERWLYYMDKPWNCLEPYFENLTEATFRADESLIRRWIAKGGFRREGVAEALAEADKELSEAIRYRNLMDYEKACRHLVLSSAFWTKATWRELLEQDIVRAPQPEVYRPIGAKKPQRGV